ncbi:MAG: triose-phosphate isomerase [Saprospiraceae bacterium]
MSRQLIVAGNWKMNTTLKEGEKLAKAIVKKSKANDPLVIMAAPFTHLQSIGEIVKEAKGVEVAAQNCSNELSGAYTGEVSVGMLKSVGVKYVILGHSERRQYFKEGNALLAKKTNTVLGNGMLPIFCCGEPLSVRKAGNHARHVSKQLREGLFHLSKKDFGKVVIAYEPIWAIGTGVTASPEQAQEMHDKIRKMIARKYGDKIADATTILYGGSVKPANAKEIFSQPDVDGGLVGGASLKATDFSQIIKAR